MNEPFDCVSRDILVTGNISLLINHVLDRSYNKDIKAAGRLLPVRGRGGNLVPRAFPLKNGWGAPPIF